MGFFDPKNVWGTGIEGVMGFSLRTNSGSTQNLWGMRDYGFRGLWDKRASTVSLGNPMHPLGDLSVEADRLEY